MAVRMLCALLLAGLLLDVAAQAQPEADAKAWWGRYLAQSRLVTLPDGKKLNLFCEGKGKPVVMLEAGLGSGAWAWRKVQTAVSRVTTACSYDRAGYWKSPGTDGPRDAGAEADDLAALLKAAHLPAPYVIVAHSYGGYIARLYAGRHTGDLAGLVLVDPSSAHQDKRLAIVGPRLAAADAAAQAQVKACLDDPRPPQKAQACILRKPPPEMTPQQAAWFTASQTPAFASAMDRETAAMGGLSSDQLDAEKKPLGAVPLVLLNETLPPEGTTPEEGAIFEAEWLKMHREILDISSDSDLRMVEGAHHLIQNERPDAVIQAVTEMVAKARQPH